MIRIQGRTSDRPTAGFTIVEVMVAMVAGVLVLGGIYQILLQNQKVYKAQTEVSETQQMVRTAMDIMVRDIRQAGADPNRSLFGATSKGVGLSPPVVPPPLGPGSTGTGGAADSDFLQVFMDLPRDCGGWTPSLGAASTDGSANCPSTDTCNGGSCLNGTKYDVIDKNGNGSIDIGNPALRGENELGNGIIGDTNPDEAVIYFYCESPATVWFADCPAGGQNRLYRRVDVLDNNAQWTSIVEPLADYIDLGGTPLFQYDYRPGETTPFKVIITIRGRTKNPDLKAGGYRYVQLQSEVLLQNMRGGEAI